MKRYFLALVALPFFLPIVAMENEEDTMYTIDLNENSQQELSNNKQPLLKKKKTSGSKYNKTQSNKNVGLLSDNTSYYGRSHRGDAAAVLARVHACNETFELLFQCLGCCFNVYEDK